MDIEKLKELRAEFEQMRKYNDKHYMSTLTEDDVIDLIDEAIARQSVKSEEVQEAIKLFESSLKYRKDQEEEIKKQYGGEMPNFLLQVNQKELLAIAALQEYQPWVPVGERLPESGKHVLLCCEVRPLGKRYVCDGYYAASKSITSGYSDEWDCEYDEETDEYYLPEGYYEVIKNWDDYSSIVIGDFVTHWKPLPEPPKGE